ncbi:uncharacterized protein RJT21DRAFT_121281 [Scheffersomyces amazonensis]|uniref:uncharacterized protein n=1 Tax=Scheffersomyces amazonensis TaxID=1078765 RepID=UPI00315D0E29
MPPKKYNTRSRATKEAKPQSATQRSTATIFQNVDPETLASSAATEEPKPNDSINSEKQQEQERDVELETAGFPFNITYRVQDFLNEQLTLLKSVQLLVFLYLSQIIYANYEKLEKLNETWWVIGANFIGILAALILNYVKGFAPGETKYPPEFNYLYSVLLPLLFSIVHYNEKFFNVNLALNYFIVDRLHPFFVVFSSIAFYEIYNTSEETPTFQYVIICLTHFVISIGLNYINDGFFDEDIEIIEIEVDDDEIDIEDEIIEIEVQRSFSRAEIQLISVIFTNLIWNHDLVEPYLPLVIFQKLFVSLVASTLFSYPLYLYLPYIVTGSVFSAMFYFLTNYQLQPTLGENSVVWIYTYIFENEERLTFLKVWLSLLAVIVPTIFYLAKNWSKNWRRKSWHFLIIVILLFSPSILIEQVEFTLISLLGLIIVFILAEIIRYSKFSFLGKYLSKILIQFQDEKDLQGPFNLSYIYLLVGITIPIIYDYILNGTTQVSIIRYMGVVALGLGDAIASIIGGSFGSIKWKGSDKSIQGSAAFIISNLVAFKAIDYYLSTNFNSVYIPIDPHWENLFVVTFLSAILEGTSNLNDNFFIPIILPIGYELINRCY